MLKKTEQKFFAVWLTEYIVMVRIFQKQDLMEQENNTEIKQMKNSYFQLSIQATTLLYITQLCSLCFIWIRGGNN